MSEYIRAVKVIEILALVRTENIIMIRRRGSVPYAVYEGQAGLLEAARVYGSVYAISLEGGTKDGEPCICIEVG